MDKCKKKMNVKLPKAVKKVGRGMMRVRKPIIYSGMGMLAGICVAGGSLGTVGATYNTLATYTSLGAATGMIGIVAGVEVMVENSMRKRRRKQYEE